MPVMSNSRTCGWGQRPCVDLNPDPRDQEFLPDANAHVAVEQAADPAEDLF
ncbi:MAG: hypothetical protein GTO37_07905 [Planctomycetales bacterium]|nr:hypothetical protein [Planctomycetales bacterium]